MVSREAGECPPRNKEVHGCRWGGGAEIVGEGLGERFYGCFGGVVSGVAGGVGYSLFGASYDY